MADFIVCVSSSRNKAGKTTWRPRWSLDAQLVLGYARTVYNESIERGHDPKLIAAMIQKEASWWRYTQGAKGEKGLMQILPATAALICKMPEEDLLDPHKNIRCGTMVLAHYRKKCGGPLANYLGAYNSGGCGTRTEYVTRVLARKRRAESCLARKR